MKVLIFKDIKNKRWTIWSLDRKTHLGYIKETTLINCSFVVIEEKRKQVVKNKSRFPHAWIIGTLSKKKTKIRDEQISYNPFVNKNFVNQNKKLVSRRKSVFLNKEGKVFSSSMT